MKKVILAITTVATLFIGQAQARLLPSISADSNVQIAEQYGGSTEAESRSDCQGRGTACQTAAGGNVRQTMGDDGAWVDAKSNVQVIEQYGGSSKFNARNSAGSGAKSQVGAAYNVEQRMTTD